MHRPVTNLPIIFLGLTGSTAALWLARSAAAPASVALICIAVYALPIAGFDLWFLKVHRRASTGLDFTQPDRDAGRVCIKLLGFAATIAAVAAGYWLIPEYGAPNYAPYWPLVYNGWPLLAVPYFVVLDRYMIEPHDGYWHIGLLVLGRWREIAWRAVANHGLEWVIKAFFLPLMFIQMVQMAQLLTQFDYAPNPLGYYVAGYDFLYYVDLTVACTGYILTLRVLDTHIRSTDPTVGGWVVALLCYGPFWTFAYATLFNYERNGITWGPWLADHPVLQIAWGCAILFFTALYAGAHLHFGLRFSNLTNRGILTNGLYALTKHPSYVAKNISWWLISVPFVSSGAWPDALRNCLLLAAVNVVYFLRARTEEQHLSNDPAYVAYATRMNKESLFAGLADLLPFLAYRAPKPVEFKRAGSPVAPRDELRP
jgi:hypothetical protein